MTGRVVEEGSGERIAFAQVSLIGRDSNVVRSTTTDSAGYFILEAISGQYRIRVIRIGYGVHTSESLELRPGESVTLVIRLSAQGIRLPPIEIASRGRDERGRDGFDRRRALGKGHFLTLDSILARKPIVTADLFDGIRGVRVVDSGHVNIFSMTGGKCFWVYRDNMPQGKLAGRMPNLRDRQVVIESNPVDLIAPEWIRAVEVYRDLSEIPNELRTPMRLLDLWPVEGNQAGGHTLYEPCGMIWIWTNLGW